MSERHHHHHHHYYGGQRSKDGYAHHAGDPGPGPNRHKLYRDTDRKVIAGVCAGIANYYGWENPNWLRVGWVASMMFFLPFSLTAYFLLALVLKPAPLGAAYQTPEEERFWRTFSTRPKATFSELKHRFRALDSRLADLERAVTSDEYGLRKAFRDLERGA